jgi:pimeloyl-ACP methyl ester carboxylesterase
LRKKNIRFRMASSNFKYSKMNKVNKKLPIYVLVHGAWHGGWSWKKVKAILAEEGHTVYTPTLTGLGEHAHLLTPNVDLSTHIKDIVSLLEYEDLHNVILVGHSYAGMVITGVAQKSSNRISQLVYLDAFLPENNKAVIDYLTVPSLDEIVSSKGDGWRIPLLARLEDLGVTAQQDIMWARPRIGDHPYKAFKDTIKLTNKDVDIEKTFIQLSDFPWFVEAGERARQKGFNYRKMLKGGHNAMISAPEETALLLLNKKPKDKIILLWKDIIGINEKK